MDEGLKPKKSGPSGEMVLKVLLTKYTSVYLVCEHASALSFQDIFS